MYFNECQYFSGFLDAGKPVFLTEYLSTPEEFCPTARDLRISAIQKRGALDTFRRGCDSYYGDNPEPEPEPEPEPISTNLLTNGSFEFDLTGSFSCANPNNLAISNNAVQGNKALDVNSGAGCLYQEVPVTAGEYYTVSCDASRPGTRWSIVQLSYVDSQYNILTTDIRQLAVGEGYASYSITGTSPANTAKAVVLLYSEDQTLYDHCVLSKN